MTRQDQIDTFKNSKLEVISDGEVKAYKLTPPGRFHWCYIIFTPIGIVIGGDQQFTSGPFGTAVSLRGYTEGWFCGNLNEEYLGEKFFGYRPTGKVGRERWTNDVGWLSALQQEFKRLYAEKVTT